MGPINNNNNSKILVIPLLYQKVIYLIIQQLYMFAFFPFDWW